MDGHASRASPNVAQHAMPTAGKATRAAVSSKAIRMTIPQKARKIDPVKTRGLCVPKTSLAALSFVAKLKLPHYEYGLPSQKSGLNLVSTWRA